MGVPVSGTHPQLASFHCADPFRVGAPMANDLLTIDTPTRAPAVADPADVGLAADMPTGFRPDIEGLRAVAVIVVLLYHAQLGPFRGGFLGVDVFFVVSGYLITSLLMKDLLVRGASALPTFWARRARRLLPASLTVLVVTLLAGRYVLDPLKQADLGRDAAWASGFIVNIRYAMGDSYAAAQTTPTPLLHFWSLAVEEQFYMVWPVLMYGLSRVRWHTRGWALAIMGALALESLLAFVWMSPRAHTPTFFLLPSRAWELIVGGMLAMAGSLPLRLDWRVRAGMAWAGALAIAWPVFTYHDTANLGYTALVPVLGTAAILGASGTRRPIGPGRLLSHPVMVWIGRRSYGIYLWHWPALVLLDAQFGPLSWPVRALILLDAVGIAAISYRFLENPVRHSAWLAAVPRRSLALGGALLFVGLVAGTLMVNFPRTFGGTGDAATAPTLPVGSTASTTTVPGAVTSSTEVGTPTTTGTTQPVPNLDELVAAQKAALDEAANTISRVPKNITPQPSEAKNSDRPQVYRDGCMLQEGETALPVCTYGDVGATTVVALFGDSHAAQWFPALDLVGQQRHYRLEVFVKSGCPTADVRIKREYLDPECVAWRQSVAARLTELKPALLVMSSTSYDPGGSDVGLDSDTVWKRGLTTTLDAMRASATRLLIIGDTPLPAHQVPNCLMKVPGNVPFCGAERAKAVNRSRVELEQQIAATYDGSFVSTSSWLCGTSKCPVILGNILMWRDNNHISATMSKYLAPFLDAVVTPLLR